MDEKKCTKCGETKPLDEFYPDKRASDGRASQCRGCFAARYRANRAAVIARNREYYKANREAILEQQRAYAEAHREEIAAYRDSNSARRNAQKREWYRANRTHAAAYGSAYSASKPHVQWASQYRRRAERHGFERIIEDFTKPDVIARYGDSCAYCDSGAFEHLDHYVPVSRGGPHTLENVRPSCAACNAVKHDRHPDEWLAEQAALDDLTPDELDDLIDAEIDRWAK